jgi:hypothetical protein
MVVIKVSSPGPDPGDEPLLREGGEQEGRLGSGRTTASEKEAPNVLVNLVCSG